ncbi:TetR/AcrR family transcriptional regulator [Calothrix rhizosoleniae]|uniref:TetR/AcrR family transcriptional regulator n=1 Tax=Calothrix rhizosoleniae TaxID=888997 RepID=UPI000B4A0758|nr:TetR/AcrR family transcriptional regulator [Calothrix rhizosoleniae]
MGSPNEPRIPTPSGQGVVKSKATYHHGDLRQALIAGAIALINQQDVSSLSLRGLARYIGVSHAAPYRHFPDKEALLAVVAEEGLLELTQDLTAAIGGLENQPLQQLETTGVAYIKYAIAHPAHYRVMFSTYSSEKTQYSSLEEASQQAFMVLENVIIEGQSQGLIKSGESRQLAWVAWSLVHGLAMLLIDNQLSLVKAEDVESISSFVTRTLIEGLGNSKK